jgi:hypothetical protein
MLTKLALNIRLLIKDVKKKNCPATGLNRLMGDPVG